MNKNILKAVIITAISLFVFIFAGLFLIGYLKPRPAGLLINTNIPASVYIDGDLSGKTPYEGTFFKDKVDVKIVAEGQNDIPVYETQIFLLPGVKSVIKREFNKDKDMSSGYTAFFKETTSKEPSIRISSVPDGSQVFIDLIPKGFAPFSGLISQGEHQVLVKAVSYKDIEISTKTVPGYELNIFAELAKNKKEEDVKSAQTETKIFIQILDTPTGYLRVRSLPGSNGSEIHQVKPGEKYLFLEEDAGTGWFKIQLQPPAPGLPEGIVGWVSNEYSQKVEDQIPLTDTPE